MLPNNSADIQLNPLDKRKPTEYSNRVFLKKTSKSLLKDIGTITKEIRSLFGSISSLSHNLLFMLQSFYNSGHDVRITTAGKEKSNT